VILIGDAAHAMLPTQGQGASQALEDAEALGAFFDGWESPQATESVEEILEKVFRCRYERASLIQKYSRDAAKPATAADNKVVTM
jgi:salicylate hydroxylase